MFHKTQLRFDHTKISKTFREIYNDDLKDRSKSQWMMVGEKDGTPDRGTGSLRDMNVWEDHFDYLLDVYRGTYIEDVYEQLSERMKVYRVRFMMMWPKSIYSYHQDPAPRFHIPIETNEHAWMIVDKNIFEFDHGYTYLVDTTRPHTAMNMSMTEPRLHIVGCYDMIGETTWV